MIKTKPSDEWETPPDLFDELYGEFHFDIDLCATSENKKCCFWLKNIFDPDILNESYWPLTGDQQAGFMNPPYSNPYPFIKRALELQEKYKFTLVMLLKLDPTTKWFKLFENKSEVRLLPKRIRFYKDGKPGKHTANFPCCVVVIR